MARESRDERRHSFLAANHPCYREREIVERRRRCRERRIVLAALAVAAPAVSQAQVAGSTFLGSTYAELRDVAVGWSAKRQIIGSPVFNDLNERIGSIDDVIVTPDKSVSYAIINAGGFLAVTKHDVAVPVSQLKLVDNRLVLAGATKDALRALRPLSMPTSKGVSGRSAGGRFSPESRIPKL